MAAVTGKNKLERQFRIWVDDSNDTPRDLSGDLIPGSVTGGGLVFDDAEVTGVSEAVKNFLAGHAESEISATFRMNDTATTGSHTVLSGIDGAGPYTVTLQWGSNGAPATGDIEWEGEYTLMAYGPMTFTDNSAAMPVTFKPNGSVAPAWGTVA